jgi:predicted phage terminase large subunit-like protein
MINDKSFYDFFLYFWPEMSSQELVNNWHIKYLCDELQDMAEKVMKGENPGFDYLLINIPPGTTKSSIVSRAFPVWVWSKWYQAKFITGSHNSTLALELAEDSRDLIQNEVFQRIYPEIGLKAEKSAKSNYKIIRKEKIHKGQRARITPGGGRLSTSIGTGSIGFHGHFLLVDDPLNPEGNYSEAEIKKASRWITQTLSTRKVDKEVVPIVIIMQRIHQNDPSGHILDTISSDRIKHICLPGEIENYKEQLKPKHLEKFYENNLLDKVRLNWDILSRMEESLGQYSFAGQVGQKPTPPGGGMFKVDNFSVIEQMPSPVNIKKIVRYWDKAGSEGKGAFTVGVKMALTVQGHYIVMDVKRGQWSSEKRERIIRQMAEADGVDVAVYIEQEPGSGGKESAESTIRNLAGYSVHKDAPTGDKAKRADPYSVQVNNGNVHLLRGEWNSKYKDELSFFPFGTYKDQVDASSGAFAKLSRKKKSRGI